MKMLSMLVGIVAVGASSVFAVSEKHCNSQSDYLSSTSLESILKHLPKYQTDVGADNSTSKVHPYSYMPTSIRKHVTPVLKSYSYNYF